MPGCRNRMAPGKLAAVAGEDLTEQVGAIGDDPVDVELDQVCHPNRVVHGPHRCP